MTESMPNKLTLSDLKKKIVVAIPPKTKPSFAAKKPPFTKLSVQDYFLINLIKNRDLVKITYGNNVLIIGTIVSFDQYVLCMFSFKNRKTYMIYKHSLHDVVSIGLEDINQSVREGLYQGLDEGYQPDFTEDDLKEFRDSLPGKHS